MGTEIVWHVVGRKDVAGQKGYASLCAPWISVPSLCSAIQPIRVYWNGHRSDGRKLPLVASHVRISTISLCGGDNKRLWSGGGLSSFLYCASRFTGCRCVCPFIQRRGSACLETSSVHGYRARKRDRQADVRWEHMFRERRTIYQNQEPALLNWILSCQVLSFFWSSNIPLLIVCTWSVDK